MPSRRLASIVLALLVMVIPGTQVPGVSAAFASRFVYLASNWTESSAQHSQVVNVPGVSISMTLGTNEQRYLIGSVYGQISGVTGAEQQARIFCTGPAGVHDELTDTQGSNGSWSSTNNTGAPTQVVARYLLTGGMAGAYTCFLQVKFSSQDETGSTTYTVVGGTSQTYIEDYTNKATSPGRQHWEAEVHPNCTGNDYLANACEYVNPGGALSVMPYADYTTASGTGITAYGGLELSECKPGTSQTCAAAVRGTTGSTSLTTYLRARQLDASGAYCAGAAWQFSATQTPTITSAVHHLKLHFTVSAPFVSGCAPKWHVSIYLHVSAGTDPVKVDAERFSNVIVFQAPIG